MQLTERHIVKPSDPRWDQLEDLTHKAKNLYNASLYDVRQHYFNTGKYKTWQTQKGDFARSNNPDYRALPAKISSEVLMNVGQNFQSFFNSLKSDKKTNVQLPKYKPKEGFSVLTVPKQAISIKPVEIKPGLFEYIISPRNLKLKFVSKQKDVDMIKVIPKGDHMVICVIYTVPDTSLVKDNQQYASIDLGINNIATVFYNNGTPSEIYTGRHIKSLNQYFNKTKARLQSQLGGEQKTSMRIKALHAKRMRKLEYEFHLLSRMLVNQVASKQVSKVIIGYNKGWKQDINLGKRNNQNFTSIPFDRLVKMLTYKFQRLGIEVILTEESYTSKCSFYDHETVSKHSVYAGRRVKRGLFKTSDGTVVNADVNGAANIMRKVIPDAITYAKGVQGFAISPLRLNPHKLAH